MTNEVNDWKVFRGTGEAGKFSGVPPAPPWRTFRDDDQGAAQKQLERGKNFRSTDDAIAMVNAALYLRRPMLIEGNPGTGKSSLAYAVAYELGLGTVLKWSITTRTMLRDGLYGYDAIARLQDAQLLEPGQEKQSIGNYITLGPLGTAFLPSDQPRVLLIDEIDKGDIDLPNDLLNLFEDGEFSIPELERSKESKVEVFTIDRNETTKDKKTAEIAKGLVRCRSFPLVIMTSNNEREFPAPFLRRCLRLQMPQPNETELQEIVKLQFGGSLPEGTNELITQFLAARKNGAMATDQLLNAVQLLTGRSLSSSDQKIVKGSIFRTLNDEGS